MSKAKLLESRQVYSGRVVQLSVDRLELPNGATCDLELIRHNGAAAVVPLDEHGQVLMVRQYRWATGGWLLEVPAGKLEPGEQPAVCANRETAEETGWRPESLTPMGWIWTTPGFTDERIWLYLARDLRPAEQSLGEDELLTVERLPISEAVARAADGRIQDGKSVCALLRAARLLETKQAKKSRP